MSTRRILVTGSRDWKDRRVVYRELVQYISENADMDVDSQGFPVDWNTDGWVIVHGACPTGADHWADEFAITNLIEQEPYPPNWRRFGKNAGFKRNAQMVESGADVCLAFINPCHKMDCTVPGPHGSHGATHTAALAEKAGIEVRRFTP